VQEAGGLMIANIIDRRRRPYRWRSIGVIIEPTWHDNTFASGDGDYAEHDHREPQYDEMRSVSLTAAITWAMGFDVPLTLYLYDEGTNLN
jgi:hypothetical protein